MAIVAGLHRFFERCKGLGTSVVTALRWLLSVAVLLFLLLATVNHADYLWLQKLDALIYDQQIKTVVRSDLNHPSIDNRVVIAAIDEASLQQLGHWPWSRAVLAKLITVLFEHYHIAVLGFDVAFPEVSDNRAQALLAELNATPLASHPTIVELRERWSARLHDDEQLAQVIGQHKVVMGYVFNAHENTRINHLTHAISELAPDWHHRLGIPQPRGFSASLPLLHDAAQHSGFFDNPALDHDGVFRRLSMVQEFDGKIYPALALAMASVALDDAPITLNVQSNRDGTMSLSSLQLAVNTIPLDANGALLVPYRGYEGHFPYLSIGDVISKKIAPSQLKNKWVLVGATAPGLNDLRATPLQSAFPGVEVHANVLSGLIDQRLWYTPDYMVGAQALLLLMLFVLASLIFTRCAIVTSTVAMVMLLGVVLIVRYVLWQHGIVLPVTALLLLIGALYLLHSVSGYIKESAAKRLLTQQFGQYVPPELVAQMAAQPSRFSLQGQARELTVLFSDVRGFTALSEHVPADALTELMNQLLTPLTRVIHHQHGTIDKYMGDAIMAFWGAPLTDAQHAHHAVLAALQMQQAMIAINRDFAQKNWPTIQIGIGLNTGVMRVGNMGSQFRMAYTVLGDAVNIGSRLEGLTKIYGADILVSEATRLAAPAFAYREIDRVRVKGKTQALTLYQPLGFIDELDAFTRDSIDNVSMLLTHYRAQQWDAAETALNELPASACSAPWRALYLERIAAYRRMPPSADWDGVFTHHSK